MDSERLCFCVPIIIYIAEMVNGLFTKDEKFLQEFKGNSAIYLI